jgi:predicted transcriptional regulator
MTTTATAVHDNPPLADDLLLQLYRFSRVLSPKNITVRLINEDNYSPGTVPWHEGLIDRAYAVKLTTGVRYHAVALDFDTKRWGPEEADVEAMTVHDLFVQAGIGCIATESGPQGGRHVLATIQEPYLSAKDALWITERLVNGLHLKTLDTTPMLNPKSGAIRPPFSAHRLGGRSRILTAEPDEAFRILERRNHPGRFQDLGRALPDPSKHRRLEPPAEAQASVRKSGPGRTDQSGSADVQALATRLVNREAAFDDFVRLTADGSALGPAGREAVGRHERAGDLDRWLRLSWTSAKHYVAQNPSRPSANATPDSEVLDSWQTLLDPNTLPNGARRVAQILLKQAVSSDRILIGMSVREAAERAGLSRSTAGRALADLESEGYIAKAGNAHHGQATRYRLQPAAAWHGVVPGTVSPPTALGRGQQTVPGTSRPLQLATDVAANVWSSQGLGETARRVYEAAARRGSSGSSIRSQEIADTVDRTVRTVQKHLRGLQAVGLMRRTERGYWEVEYRDADDVAFDLGVVTIAADRAATHARERRADRINGAIAILRAKGTAPFHLEAPDDDALPDLIGIKNHSQNHARALSMPHWVVDVEADRSPATDSLPAESPEAKESLA